jgi:futalosine hydrolase
MIISIFCSVSHEAKIILDSLIDCETLSSGIVTGMINNKQIIVAITGIGKVNAAHICSKVINQYLPDIVISTGIGGAYPETGLNVGDIAIATEEIYGDEGVICKDGFKDMTEIGLPMFRIKEREFYNKIELENVLCDRIFNIVKKRWKCKKGAFITVSTCSGTLKRAKELRETFNGLCENMEGASIAHISKLYGLPMVELRGISNIVEDRNKSTWEINIASKNAQNAVLAVLEEI